MVTLTITSKDGSHSAHCGFGTTDFGSPLDSMDAFLKQLKSGMAIWAEEKISKSGKELEKAAPWVPLDCGGIDLGDDFRPFVGKKLKRVRKTKFIVEFVTE